LVRIQTAVIWPQPTAVAYGLLSQMHRHNTQTVMICLRATQTTTFKYPFSQ